MSNYHEFNSSSMLQSCDYNEAEKILSVTFSKGNKEYKYADVPKSVYEDLKSAESAGKFFLAYIKPVFSLVE